MAKDAFDHIPQALLLVVVIKYFSSASIDLKNYWLKNGSHSENDQTHFLSFPIKFLEEKNDAELALILPWNTK